MCLGCLNPKYMRPRHWGSSLAPTPLEPVSEPPPSIRTSVVPTPLEPISQQPPPIPMPSVPPARSQIPPIPQGLPSQADATFAACPKFRIVLIGNSGVGKSSLVRNVFNMDPEKLDIAHGDANIEHEYTSPENPRFILHDSKGFEAGSNVNWGTVEKFFKDRHAKELPERIHAIWFCVETPQTGIRLLERGDEKLLALARELNIIIVAVFTKYDLLVQQFRVEGMSEKEANSKASESFQNWTKEFKESQIRCVRISNNGSGAHETLRDLTTVTREKLREVEDELLAPWIAAQHVDARQKVDLTISEGFKKYWLDLAHSSAFKDQILIDCVHRIHEDVLKAWNFNDPAKILSQSNFFVETIALVKPLIDGQDDQISLDPKAMLDFDTTGATPSTSLLGKFGLSPSDIDYLRGKYQPHPLTAKFLTTYIVNLILVMHRVFAILRSDPPTALSDVLVSKVLTDHRADLKKEPLEEIKSVPDPATYPKELIKNVIWKRLGFDKAEGDK